MTSSGTPTKSRAKSVADNEAPAGSGIGSWMDGRRGLAVGGSALAAGWLLILHVHNWRFGAGVLFLWLGWLAVLLVGRFLWNAALSVATEPATEEDEGFEIEDSRRDELEREKRSLLKAIKEVEFDHALGKMSDEDAEEIIMFYRVRAIEVLRQLERIDRGEARGDLPASVSDLIDREVRARLALFGPRRAKAAADAAKSAEAEAEPEEDQEARPAKAKEAK